ncbi:MAG: hypothetical protein HY332_09885 [Chloroflexi bacterium]|nr:hypothetical protein [Chloroflexota bacterium]
MAGEAPPEQPATVRAERTRDEVIFRFPTPNRLLRSILPQEAIDHLYAAQREQLLAARAMVDAAIKRLERAQRGESASGPRHTEIRVD